MVFVSNTGGRACRQKSPEASGPRRRLHPSAGYRLRGSAPCLPARQRGLASVAGALCFHNPKGVELPPAFSGGGRAFAQRWAGGLPVKTKYAVVDQHWLAIGPSVGHCGIPTACQGGRRTLQQQEVNCLVTFRQHCPV